MRGQCLLRDIDEHRVKKRSFAFTVGYIYCFRTYLLYLSFRHGVLILYRRATFLLRGRRGRSRAAHGFNFAVKVRHRRYHRSPIQPLSQNLRFCQLPLHRGAENALRSAEFVLKICMRALPAIWFYSLRCPENTPCGDNSSNPSTQVGICRIPPAYQSPPHTRRGFFSPLVAGRRREECFP